MNKRILINAITLDGLGPDGGNCVPLLSKIKTWQSVGCEITIFGSAHLKSLIDAMNLVEDYHFVELENVRPAKYKLTFIMESLRRNMLAAAYLRRFEGKYDVVYSISSVLDLLIFPYFLKRRDNKIIFLAVFDNYVPFFKSGKIIINFLASLFFQISLMLLRRADKIFAVSKDLKCYLMQKGFLEKQIFVTGNAVEGDLIEASREDDRYRFDALFLGRISADKGIYDALEVLSIVRQKYPNYQFAIVGRGDIGEENRLKNKVNTMGLENNVRLLGTRVGQEKFNIIKSSKCFWCFSESESFGLSLLEAVCCGLPAFAYDLKAFRDIYKNNEVHFFPKKDVAGIADKVLEVFDRKEFDNSAGRLLINRFKWDDIAKMELSAMDNSRP